MALDRQSIEKRDFPVGRRGYDPEAVDAHLSALADEVAEYRRSLRRRSDTLASSASDQVRSIVEAAETSAAEIQREAEADAREIREEAASEARAAREQATEQARDYVGKVSESTDTMLTRLESMQSELDGLIDSLRSGSGRLGSDLKLLQNNLQEVSTVVAPQPEFEPDEPDEPEPPAPAPAPAPAAPSVAEVPLEPIADQPIPASPAPSPVVAPAPASAAAASPVAATSADADQDAEGARLIALNMALNGTPREETARYLGENFSLANADGLLDEVYASVEG